MGGEDLKALMEAARTASDPAASTDDLQALLNAARSDNKPELLDPRAEEVNEFIARFMRPGTQPIAAPKLYQIFLKKSTGKGVGPRVFYSYVEKYFQSSRGSGIMYYRLDPTVLGLVADYSMYKDPEFTRKRKSDDKARKKRKKAKQE